MKIYEIGNATNHQVELPMPGRPTLDPRAVFERPVTQVEYDALVARGAFASGSFSVIGVTELPDPVQEVLSPDEPRAVDPPKKKKKPAKAPATTT